MSEIILAVIFSAIFMQMPVTDGISCYVCEETTSRQTCQSGEKLIHDRLKGGVFVRNCTDRFCKIEAIMNIGGATVSFIRGCTDGNYAGRNVSLLAERVRPNNLTECAFDELSKLKYCIVLCRTNYCNGPQILDTSGGTNGQDLSFFYSVSFAWTMYIILH
ncbi:uncharacterized protein LOC125657687 [Ostrea edulis]|uniref:uncharacterized protein LOC125657687 n=1 Tax=Ostrea edulis TaxID=37623 RepID=UPI00209624F0|nr:uncharacterized protein LOC125657687 [Ostrea edulis]